MNTARLFARQSTRRLLLGTVGTLSLYTVGNAFIEQGEGLAYNQTGLRVIRLLKFADKQGANDHTILFVHGKGSSRDTWDTILKSDLNKSYRLVAVDLPGHGTSPNPANNDYSTSKMVKTLDEFISNELRKDKVVLVGHSMGTRVVIPYSAAHPNKVESLVLEDLDLTPRAHDEPSSEELAKLKSFKRSHTTLEELKSYLEHYGYSSSRIDFLVSKHRIRQLLDTHSWWCGISPYVDYLAHKALLSTTDSRDAFKKLQTTNVPVLLIVASNDSCTSNEGIKEMKQIMPRLKVEVIPESGHSVHNDRPVEFIQSLRHFAAHHHPTDKEN